MWAFVMMTTKVSSTNLFHNKGGFGDDYNALISKFSMKIFATIGLMGEPHGSSFYLLIEFASMGEICAPEAELQQVHGYV